MGRGRDQGLFWAGGEFRGHYIMVRGCEFRGHSGSGVSSGAIVTGGRKVGSSRMYNRGSRVQMGSQNAL